MFSLAAVTSLALGVGLTTTLFSVVNAVLLRDTPIARPDQLVEIYSGFKDFPQLTTSNDALPAILVNLLPPVVGTIGLAAVFSAEISASDAVLFMLTTSLSQDLYKRFVHPGASDAQVLLVARWTAVVAAALGVALAIGLASVIDALIGSKLGVTAHVLGTVPYAKGSGFTSDSFLVQHGSWVRPKKIRCALRMHCFNRWALELACRTTPTSFARPRSG